jgi:hypothetical protein
METKVNKDDCEKKAKNPISQLARFTAATKFFKSSDVKTLRE